MKLPANITFMDLHRDSGLLAVVCDDLIVRVLDIETRRIVRELSGPRRPILDMVSRMHRSFGYYAHLSPLR
jgi:U3 small nucleolar RNA-associated protein 21